MARSSDHLDGLSGESERRLERLFTAFDEAWRKGMRPRISAHLPVGPPHERKAALVELALIDFEYASGRDPSARIEAYLVEFPELAADRDLVLELADREYILRRDRGETPSVKEYVGRFPDLAARLVFRLGDDATPTPPMRSGDRRSDETDLVHRSPTPFNPLITVRDETVPVSLPDQGPPRYVHIRPHAKGGLGEVFIADDSTLNRKVALKRIRPDHSSDETVRLRFFREAEITAKIEHKGIAPIHELITDRLGQPWYVMRFVKGHTLRSTIERFYKPKSQSDPAARHLEFRAILSRFIAICETMAYAHRLGIVHRDLKPANVILGEYGETIVLDWGLATASGQVDTEFEQGSIGIGLSPLDASLMKSGKLIGTPAFMAPEQAAGHQSMVGPATDIYCLGAILFMILTGQPPFPEKEVSKLLDLIQAGTFSKPREVLSDVSPALEAICLKAMNLKAEARYSDTLELGTDIERWLAGEPVSVYREPVLERLGRSIRQYKRRVAMAAFAAVCAVALLGAYLFSAWKEQNALIVEADGKFASAEALAIKAKNDPIRWSDAIDTIQDALEKYNRGQASRGKIALVKKSLESYQQERKDYSLLNALEGARLLGAATQLSDQNDRNSHAGDLKVQEYKRLFQEYGLDVQVGSQEDVAAKIRKHPLRETLVAILYDWAFDTSDDLFSGTLSGIAGLADDDTDGGDFRRALKGNDRNEVISLASKSKRSTTSPVRLGLIGKKLLGMDAVNEAAEFLEETRARYPGDFWLNQYLAAAYWRMTGDARKKATRHFAIAESRIPNAVTRTNYANALLADDDSDGAIRRYLLAIEEEPCNHTAHYGLAYATKDDDEKAAAEYLLALKCRPNYERAHNSFVTSMKSLGKTDECIKTYRKLIAENSSAEFYTGLGIALNSAGDSTRAIAALETAIQKDKKCAAAYSNLGRIQFQHGQMDDAIRLQKHAAGLQTESPFVHFELAEALRVSRDYDQAITEYKLAIKKQPNFRKAHWSLGLSQLEQGRIDEALIELNAANTLLLKDPKNLNKFQPGYDSILKIANTCHELEPRLPDLMAGKDRVKDAYELYCIGLICEQKKYFAAAVKFWTDSFAADSNQRLHFEIIDRRDVICAVQAATGSGKDAPPSSEAKEKLLTNALTWLNADLRDLEARITPNDPAECTKVLKELTIWQHDVLFAPVRESTELEKLLPKQRAEWSEAWKRVAATAQLAKKSSVRVMD